MVGIDGSLRQARPKATGIVWLQAEAAALPLASARIDFASRIERDLGQAGVGLARPDHLCFATVRGDKP